MKFKANILLITLFLLMMSSLSALLVTSYIKNLIRLSASFHDYYKGYYISNAGLELALVKTNGNVRGYGFEDEVLSGSTTFSNNFSGSKTYFSTVISTSSLSLGDVNTSDSTDVSCNATTVTQMGYEIPPGGCVPIILLRDSKADTLQGGEGQLRAVPDTDLVSLSDDLIGNDITIFGTTGFTALLTNIEDDGNELVFKEGRSKKYTLSDLTSEGGRYKAGNLISNIKGDPIEQTDQLILMIANTDTVNTGHYCLSSNSVELPTQYVTITSVGAYGNVGLTLKGVRKAGLPADFCYTAISSN